MTFHTKFFKLSRQCTLDLRQHTQYWFVALARPNDLYVYFTRHVRLTQGHKIRKSPGKDTLVRKCLQFIRVLRSSQDAAQATASPPPNTHTTITKTAEQ